MSIEEALNHLETACNLMQKAKRDAPNGVTIAHTFTTPEFILISTALMEVRYAINDIVTK